MRRPLASVFSFALCAVAQQPEVGVSGPIYRPGEGITNPEPIYHPEPQYSEDARKAKLQGSVYLSVLVNEEGKPVNARVVVRPLGLGLDQKAIQAVLKWKFKPGMKDGQAVAVRAQYEIIFRLP